MRQLLVAVAIAIVVAPAAAGDVIVRGLDTTRLPLVRAVVTADPPAPGKTPTITVSENGRPIGALEVAAPDGNAAIVLAIDTSGSMKGTPLRAALAAAGEFLGSVKGDDRVAIVNFGRTALMAQPLTSDRGALATTIEGLKTDSVKGTALHDALKLGVAELQSAPATARRILVVLTDGRDSSSLATIEDVATAATAAQVAVYPIALESTQFDPDPLRRLAGATGGSFRDSSKEGLTDVYRAVADEIAKTYILTWRTSEAERVDLVVAADGAEAKTGYDAGAPAVLQTATGVVPESITRSSWSPFAVAGGAFLLVLVGVLIIFRPRPHRTVAHQLESYTEFSRRVKDADDGSERVPVHIRLGRSTERVLGGLQFWKKMAGLIERADLPLRTAELFYIQLGVALLLGMPAGFAGIFPIATLGLFAVGFMLPVVWVKLKARKRAKAFDSQLPDTLVAIAASLKAGHSWNQAIETIIREGSEPTSKEFGRVANEVRLGRPNDDAMQSMAERIGSIDFEFVVMSVNIQRQVGGSLAELLDQVADTVRQRQQFRRKVKALCAMGRMSAYTLVALPFLMGLAIVAINPSYIAPLFNTGTGRMLVVIALVAISLGAMILKKIVSFRV